MLKIELTRFEVEDIITASIIDNPTTNEGTKDEYDGPACICNHSANAPHHGAWSNGYGSEWTVCPAEAGHHTGPNCDAIGN